VNKIKQIDKSVARAKHLRPKMLETVNLRTGKVVEVQGFPVTEHFALTVPLEPDRAEDGYFNITHIQTGAGAVFGIRPRRVAEIVCRVLEAQPVDWNFSGHDNDGQHYTGIPQETFRPMQPLFAWLKSLQYCEDSE